MPDPLNVRTVYGLGKTKSLKCCGTRRCRSDGLSTGLGGNLVEVGENTGPLEDALSALSSQGVGTSTSAGNADWTSSGTSASGDGGGDSFVLRR